MHLRLLATATAMLALTAVAHADGITYNVNESGSNYSAVGTITTDGRTGTLMDADITSFNIEVAANGASPITLDNSVFGVYGLDLSGTTSGLFFNFTGNQHSFFGLGLDSYLCFSDTNGCGGGYNSVVVSVNGTAYNSPALSGIQQIASAQTPEPSSLALLGTGVLGVLGAASRRFSR